MAMGGKGRAFGSCPLSFTEVIMPQKSLNADFLEFIGIFIVTYLPTLFLAAFAIIHNSFLVATGGFVCGIIVSGGSYRLSEISKRKRRY